MKSATLFLNEITCIDHAFIHPGVYGGSVQGGSFLASFSVTGNIDPTEQVVVDFSTLKKDIKAIIDDSVTGIDHKLWVFPGAFDVTPLEKERVLLANSHTVLDLPSDAVFFAPGLPKYDYHYCSILVRDLVQSRLEMKYPGIKVACTLSEKPTTVVSPYLNQALCMFRYTHGLKDSTSYGCTNIAHGHLSFINFSFPEDTQGEQREVIEKSLATLASAVDKAVMVKRENIEYENESRMCISYATSARGLFRAIYSKDLYKIIVTDDETTVENLTKNLLQMFCDLDVLRSAGVSSIELSEGLQKGAVLHLN